MSHNLLDFSFPPIHIIKQPKQLKSSGFQTKIQHLKKVCQKKKPRGSHAQNKSSSKQNDRIVIYMHAWFEDAEATAALMSHHMTTHNSHHSKSFDQNQTDSDVDDYFTDSDDDDKEPVSASSHKSISSFHPHSSKFQHSSLSNAPSTTSIQCFLIPKLPEEPNSTPPFTCYILDFRHSNADSLLSIAWPFIDIIMNASCFKVFFDSREQGYVIDHWEQKFRPDGPFQLRPVVDLSALFRKLFPMHGFCTFPDFVQKLYVNLDPKIQDFITHMMEGYEFSDEWTQQDKELAAFPCSVFPMAYTLLEKTFKEQGKSPAFISLVRKESRLMFHMYISDARRGSSLQKTLQQVKKDDPDFIKYRKTSILERFGRYSTHITVDRFSTSDNKPSARDTTRPSAPRRSTSSSRNNNSISSSQMGERQVTEIYGGTVEELTDLEIQQHSIVSEHLDQSNKEDMKRLLEILPREMSYFVEPYADKLIEIVLDYARPLVVRIFADEQRTHMEDVELEYNDGLPLEYEDIEFIVSAIAESKGEEYEELFREDNRTGINGTLHRISCIRNRNQRIIGLTMRVGRVCRGCFSLIEDLVQADKSLLIVGAPGSGKSTLLRQVAKYCSSEKRERVVIVDTSNEIAGDGDEPHSEIGRARRLQVSSIKHQDKVMLEAIANHTPQRLIIDEISTRSEAASASTISQRGIRIVATAHGRSIESLMNNKELDLLLGGFSSVTVGDATALAHAQKHKKSQVRKMQTVRKQAPVFDAIIELRSYDCVAIFNPLSESLDELLESESTWAEVRKQVSDRRIEKRHERFEIQS